MGLLDASGCCITTLRSLAPGSAGLGACWGKAISAVQDSKSSHYRAFRGHEIALKWSLVSRKIAKNITPTGS